MSWMDVFVDRSDSVVEARPVSVTREVLRELQTTDSSASRSGAPPVCLGGTASPCWRLGELGESLVCRPLTAIGWGPPGWLLGLGAVLLLSGCPSPREDYQPEQPIAYSHKLHAGDLQIDCRYCHVTVDEGRHASLPSTNICMNCHSGVGKDKDGVIKLTKYYDDNRPIPWVKVHDLPDFVYFDHSRHLKQGLECERCHGKPQEMEVIRVTNAFNMGWCIDCHRNPDPKRPELKGPTDCTFCHR